MKEIMLPYILLVWLLFKFNVLKRTPSNYFATTLIGALLMVSLFFAHRFYSPADLTNSTTVKAPHAILSPAFGQQIDRIYIDHNQQVRKGEVLYTLRDDKIAAAIVEVEAGISEIAKSIEAKQVEWRQAKRNHKRNVDIQEHATKKDVEQSGDLIELIEAELAVLEAKFTGLQARLSNLEFEHERLTVTAPFDGMVTHIFIADGSRVGALHLWDINRKFIEMRIPDQAYKNIRPGQFSEFYVDSYPGEIFRAKVHSIVNATGEAQGSLMPIEQRVAGHIMMGSAPVGRTVILEMDSATMALMPIGATGSAWISADKPHRLLGFLDIIGGAGVRLTAAKSYLQAL
ncbi:efflux RND transporter periplasmic adaptor subunit [Vibrio sp. SCSIO 43135]|uniref:HlyD family secretion protein n=1 Tax=Vibrio sp. SCSIO 43135 TaxID=2819096 RepID=UPI002075CB56|nr:efflux RND transporter periplasmic adaptor subunit [Vibrio sp. SCSIO 43135]USD43399.1 efflux RND transporter periplasmic adaptor subunit [Vibrio sp. SCSIO 43135]